MARLGGGALLDQRKQTVVDPVAMEARGAPEAQASILVLRPQGCDPCRVGMGGQLGPETAQYAIPDLGG